LEFSNGVSGSIFLNYSTVDLCNLICMFLYRNFSQIVHFVVKFKTASSNHPYGVLCIGFTCKARTQDFKFLRNNISSSLKKFNYDFAMNIIEDGSYFTEGWRGFCLIFMHPSSTAHFSLTIHSIQTIYSPQRIYSKMSSLYYKANEIYNILGHLTTSYNNHQKSQFTSKYVLNASND